jgi:hypothetical protein
LQKVFWSLIFFLGDLRELETVEGFILSMPENLNNTKEKESIAPLSLL